MSNLFAGINLALNAILAHQQSMQVIEHNVANANTPGYHRQEAVLTAGIPYPSVGSSRGIMPGYIYFCIEPREVMTLQVKSLN